MKGAACFLLVEATVPAFGVGYCLSGRVWAGAVLWAVPACVFLLAARALWKEAAA